MAVVGCLGDIVFTVSDRTIKTIDNMTWSGSARYAEHKRHGQNALTEFVGLDADVMTFEIYLSASLGVNVMGELVKLWNYERRAIAVPLILGTHAYGKYRWTITSHKTKVKHFDGSGNLLAATVSVTLLEYLRY